MKNGFQYPEGSPMPADPVPVKHTGILAPDRTEVKCPGQSAGRAEEGIWTGLSQMPVDNPAAWRPYLGMDS
jgi:hypothetical protein